MLQITLIAVAAILCLARLPAAASGAPGSAESAPVRWLMEDALKEENVPLLQTNIITPGKLSQAMDYYKGGNYRFASQVLEKLRDLNLPDGRLDFIYFALAECYRQLNLTALSVEAYQTVTKHFPNGPYAPPAYFRLLQHAYDERNAARGDSLAQTFQARFASHPLLSSVLYVKGKLLYRAARFADAAAALTAIPRQSALYYQAQFLTALCCVQTKDYDKGLILLESVRKNSYSEPLVAEASVTMGDIYYGKENFPTAITFYSGVSRGAKRYPYAQVKIARAYLDMRQYAKARDLAKSFIARYPASDYKFEMLSILSQAYIKLKDEPNAARAKALVMQQLQNARYAFELSDELGHAADISRQWEILKFTALQKNDPALLRTAQDNLDKLDILKSKLSDLSAPLGLPKPQRGEQQFSGFAERRYAEILKRQIAKTQDSLAAAQAMSDSLRKMPLAGRPDSSIRARRAASAGQLSDTLRTHALAMQREYAMVVKECLGNLPGKQKQDEEMQAKYVDWAFINYQDQKAELASMNKDLMQRSLTKPGKGADSLKREGGEIAKAFTASDIDKAGRELSDMRAGLIQHINSMLYTYPQSRFTPAILMRLAELHFDQADDEFAVKLHEYEKKMAQGDKGLVFPEYDLSGVITVYDKIIKDFPEDELADNAYFYKALALQKTNRFDEANAVLVEMTKKYPESEFFVEATMNIARYYFEHPKIQGGKGYKLAEEAYHKVLYYRDHPQFVSALYSLGWCYYMEDQFDEAIAVFKYLIEEVALDFDVTKMDEKKQMTNPLLRDEAIDYIAISFDEEKRIDDAVKFLALIGNIDYAAMVLKRIAELREEDMDYPAAIRIYDRLLTEYPQSIAAPDASMGKIKMYELLRKRDEAFTERQDFFKRYAKNGLWQSVVWKRDSLLIPRVDSIAISIGQFIADEKFRAAEIRKDTASYAAAAQSYRELVNAYPANPGALDARWNLAVILDTKLNRGTEALREYAAFSKLAGVDLPRREQAALNAIALAQRMLPPDSAAAAGKLEDPALRLIDAVNNYTALFPSGKHFGEVELTLGSIYFNRRMFSQAAKTYRAIIDKAGQTPEYYEALYWLAQCHFGQENWEAASKAFETVAKNSPNDQRRTDARKFLLQSEFSRAQQAFTAQAYKQSADIFLSIDNRYPGSEYGDAVLFKAAECFEKTQKWTDACDAYYRLARNYAQSKLAPSALFNAATDYEKAGKYDKAAEAYELTVSNYPQSDKMKDALFNLGLCYEKLGNADKVAETNERYARLFPGEKDVESMLIRTADYYVKANLGSKAVTIYRNFVRQFPQSPKTVDALYMIGKVFKAQNDPDNAALNFSQAEQQNLKLAAAGLPGNSFAAAEAANGLATMKREQFDSISFTLPDAKFKADQKTKAALLLDAVRGYERVIKYQSEKMFEAAYWIGQMYAGMAEAWKKQERPKLDPIKAAVLEKEIDEAASGLLQKSFIPYKKVIELSAGFDSMNAEQKGWVHKAKVDLARDCYLAGDYLVNASDAMQNAPVPEEIKSKPLYYYQYVKQLVETLEPMKLRSRNYFLAAYGQLDSLKLLGENSEKCLGECARINVSLGADYDKLADQILRQPNLPKDLTPAQKEDLTFQLEDVVYELQDKAILSYEDGLRFQNAQPVLGKQYGGKIIAALARLSPEKYGKNFFQRVYAATGKQWFARCDSTVKWNTKDAALQGWKPVAEAPSVKAAPFPFDQPAYVWMDSAGPSAMYLKGHVFLNGAPREAAVHYAVSGRFWLYVNGTLTASDTSGKRQSDRRDSITGVSKLFAGGDNDISMHVESPDSPARGAAVAFSFYVDTTQHFAEDARWKKLMAPAGQSSNNAAGAADSSSAAKRAHAAKDSAQKRTQSLAYDHIFKNRGELRKAIAGFRLKEQGYDRDIKKERLELQKLHIQNDDLDADIRKVKDETAALKKSMEDAKRTK